MIHVTLERWIILDRMAIRTAAAEQRLSGNAQRDAKRHLRNTTIRALHATGLCQEDATILVSAKLWPLISQVETDLPLHQHPPQDTNQ